MFGYTIVKKTRLIHDQKLVEVLLDRLEKVDIIGTRTALMQADIENFQELIAAEGAENNALFAKYTQLVADNKVLDDECTDTKMKLGFAQEELTNAQRAYSVSLEELDKKANEVSAAKLVISMQQAMISAKCTLAEQMKLSELSMQALDKYYVDRDDFVASFPKADIAVTEIVDTDLQQDESKVGVEIPVDTFKDIEDVPEGETLTEKEFRTSGIIETQVTTQPKQSAAKVVIESKGGK